MMKNWLFLLLALPLVVFSCRKDTDITTTTGSEYQPPVVIVTGNLVGQIIDGDEQVVAGALVRVGNNAVVSDEFGLYRFEDIQMNAKGTYITVSRDGYFLGSDRIHPQIGATNFSRIQLLRKELAGTVNNTAGGTLEVAGAKVTFPANSIVNAQGAVVDGAVEVYAQWLNPADENLGDYMPGGLFGVNAEGQEVTMTSMGMLAVELFDGNGNALNIAAGKEATLQFPVPAELLSIAPSTIPLWYFDETDGVWIEDGSATLDGSVYTGQVSHFTFWNVDFPYGTETVEISGCVKYDDQSPATFYNFTVSIEGSGTIIWGNTDSNGDFYGPVPVNETLIFNFSDGCGNNQQFTVDPLTEDTELEGCFIINTGEPTTLSGQLVDCDGNPVDGGIVLLQNYWPWQVLVADEEGNFSYTFDGCTSSTFTVTAYDYDNGQATDPTTYTISEDTDLGQIAVCDVPLDQILDSDADGLEFTFYELSLAQDSISWDSLGIEEYWQIAGSGFDEFGNQNYISLSLSSIDVGTYSGQDVGYTYNHNAGQQGSSSFYLSCWVPCNTVTINITNNEGPGGFLEGDYSGTSDGWDAMQLPLEDRPVSGTFRVRIPN